MSNIQPKSKESMLSSLEKNLPVKAEDKSLVISTDGGRPSDTSVVKDIEDDYKFARDKLKNLLQKSDDALDSLMNLAMDAEHPRAYEVLTAMIKNTSDITEQLLTLQRRRKDLLKKDTEKPAGVSSTTPGNTTNNNIFVGSTSELQKFLATHKPEEKNVTNT